VQTKIIGGGVVNPGTELGVDPTFLAARISIRPVEYAQFGQILGHYRWSGTIAAQTLTTAGAVLMAARWADSSRFCVVQRLSMGLNVTSALTAAAGIGPFVTTVQRAYTARETTNISANLVPTGNSGKARILMGSSLLDSIFLSTAAAGISGGTRTADAQPISSLSWSSGLAAAAGQPMDDFVRYDQLSMHPLVLSQNEGFTVASPTPTPTAGIAVINFVMAWAEVVVY